MKNIDLLAYQPTIPSESHLFSTDKPRCSATQIKSRAFLSSVPEEALADLLKGSKTLTYPKRVLIASEGDVVNAFFIILSGKVRVFSSGDKSREVTINVLGSGAYFGEIDLLTDKPSSVSIMTVEKTICAVIPRHDFINWLLNYPCVAINLLGALAEKIWQMTDKVRQMALLNVYERTVKVLENLTVEGQDNVIYDRPSQQDLADMVGASREMVSKIMRDLMKGGYVKIANDTLIINRTLPSAW